MLTNPIYEGYWTFLIIGLFLISTFSKLSTGPQADENEKKNAQAAQADLEFSDCDYFEYRGLNYFYIGYING